MADLENANSAHMHKTYCAYCGNEYIKMFKATPRCDKCELLKRYNIARF